MKVIGVLVAMLALVSTSIPAAASDTPTYPSISWNELMVTGPHDGGRIQLEAEFLLNSDLEFFTTFEEDPANIAALSVQFYRPGTKADAGPDGTIPELVSNGGELVWEQSPPLPIHMGRIWTIKELLTPPVGSTWARVRGLFKLGYLDTSHDQWFELGKLSEPTGANQNPTVDTPAVSPAKVTTATKMIAVTAVAADPDGDELSYTWYVDGAPVAGPAANLNGIELDRLELGEYTVRVEVDDGRSGTAAAEARIQRRQREERTTGSQAHRAHPPYRPPGPERPEVT